MAVIIIIMCRPSMQHITGCRSEWSGVGDARCARFKTTESEHDGDDDGDHTPGFESAISEGGGLM